MSAIASNASPRTANAAGNDHERHLVRVEETLRSIMTNLPGNRVLETALHHHLDAGGQRFRAQLCIDASIALGISEQAATAMASGCELLHNASLVQDDLQDRDETRRGHTSVWAEFGDDVAIGLTDALISSAFAALADVDDHTRVAALVKIAHAAVAETVAGQHSDLAFRESPQQTVAAYLSIARAKSGPLVALAMQLPMTYCGSSTSLTRAGRAACAFATAYQIVDDLRDRESDRATDGNPGALNLIHLLEALDVPEPTANAVAIAEDHLAVCRFAAPGLPQGIGAPLLGQANVLEDTLRRLRHDG
ncbi:MAG: polyprenyl synthetase family protein [Pseudomonadota bacterium]